MPQYHRHRVSSEASRLQILAFVEGNTEEQYLAKLQRVYKKSVIINIDQSRGLAPFTLVRKASELKKRELREQRRGRAHDQFWCIFDVDEHAHLLEALEMARSNGIRVALSSPCLELWFLLHFSSQTAEISRQDAQHKAYSFLKCPSKNLDQRALDGLISRADDAMQRSIELEKKHEGDGSGPLANPRSGLWRLLAELQAIVPPEPR